MLVFGCFAVWLCDVWGCDAGGFLPAVPPRDWLKVARGASNVLTADHRQVSLPTTCAFPLLFVPRIEGHSSSNLLLAILFSTAGRFPPTFCLFQEPFLYKLGIIFSQTSMSVLPKVVVVLCTSAFTCLYPLPPSSAVFWLKSFTHLSFFQHLFPSVFLPLRLKVIANLLHTFLALN